MLLPDEKEYLQNEFLRVKILNHPCSYKWIASMKDHTRMVFDQVMEDEVTPELIILADETPEYEACEYEFIRMIAGGNPEPDIAIALTNVTLTDILYTLEELKAGDMDMPQV